MEWFLALTTLLGVNYAVWASVGAFRLLRTKLSRRRRRRQLAVRPITLNQVAALVPAHNEELVLSDCLLALKRVLPASQIHVVSDGSQDQTASLARAAGVLVYETTSPHGKAGALEVGLAHFGLLRHYEAILLIDADTLISRQYLKKALRYFRQPEVVAVAGFAKTLWQPKKQTWLNSFILCYRDRVYALTQTLLKFGQTAHFANVTPIVPGFASLYRSRALTQININPPGLVIEDFNMTFEIHHKKLGLIAHHPRIKAWTQDPNNLGDYIRQVKRWDLGFWQTVRRHGLESSRFSAALLLLITEVLLSSLVIILLPLILLLLMLPPLTGGLALNHLPFFIIYDTLTNYLNLKTIILFIFLPDYLLSVIMAIVYRRPQYLFYGLGFLFMRVVDSALMIGTLLRAFLVQSTGRWKSPTRRSLAKGSPGPSLAIT